MEEKLMECISFCEQVELGEYSIYSVYSTSKSGVAGIVVIVPTTLDFYSGIKWFPFHLNWNRWSS